MRLDPNPLFRRIIMPWYDTTTVCWLLLFFMGVLMLFSIVGIFTALGNPVYRQYRFVPCVLAILSFLVAMSVSLRLIQRYYQQNKDMIEP